MGKRQKKYQEETNQKAVNEERNSNSIQYNRYNTIDTIKKIIQEYIHSKLHFPSVPTTESSSKSYALFMQASAQMLRTDQEHARQRVRPLFRPARLMRAQFPLVSEPSTIGNYTAASWYHFPRSALAATEDTYDSLDSSDTCDAIDTSNAVSPMETVDTVDTEFDAVVVEAQNIYDPRIPVDDYCLFVVKLAHLLHAAGETTHRLELNVELCAKKLGLECSIVAFPNTILLAFGDKVGENENEHLPSLYNRKVHLANCEQGLDGDKILLGDALVHLILQDKIPFRSAVCLLKYCEEKPLLFSMSVQVIATALSSSTIAGVFFGGSWHDILLCFVNGIVLGIFCYWSDRTPSTIRLQLIFCGFIAAFSSGMFSYYVDSSLCLSSDVLSSLCWILPGFNFTLAIIEVANGSISSGVSRLFFSLIMCAQLGAGAIFGFQLSSWISNGIFYDPDTTAVSCALDLVDYTWLFFFPMSFSWIILLNSAMRQWLIMMVVITIAMLVYFYLDPILGDNVTNTLSAMAIGISSNIFCRISNEPPNVIVLCAIFLLVPGGMGVRAVNSLISSDYAVAYGYLFGMLSCGISLSVGLIFFISIQYAGLSIANLIIYPVEKAEFASVSRGL